MKWIITWLVIQHGLLVVAAVQKLQYQLKQLRRKLVFPLITIYCYLPSWIHMLPFYYTHRKNKSLKHQHFLTRNRDPAHKSCILGNYSRQFAVLCDATELLLKVALNTITLTLNTIYIDALSYNI